MFWLALTTIFQAAFALLIKAAGRNGARMGAVGWVNYLVAAVGCAVMWASEADHSSLHTVTWQLGLLAGLGYVVNYLLLQEGIRTSGVSVTSVVMRISILIPVLGTVYWFAEIPSPLQWIGIGLAVPALVLLSSGGVTGTVGLTLGSAFSLTLLFWNTGMSHFCLKAFREYRATIPPDQVAGQQSGLILLIFGAAATGGLFLLPRPAGPKWRNELGWGTVVGLVNIGGTKFMLETLAVLPAAQAYTINTVSGIGLTAIMAALLFGEIPGPRAVFGLVLAAVAGVLLYS